jgi:hypothetical protein
LTGIEHFQDWMEFWRGTGIFILVAGEIVAPSEPTTGNPGLKVKDKGQ